MLVPPNPGITSALGCLLVDIRHDLAEMYLTRTDTADPGALEAEFKKLEAEARERLAHEGVAEAQMSLQRKIAMRYLGQWRSLAVPVDRPLSSLQAAEARFHAEHEREYSYRRDGAPLEIYQLQVTAVGVTPKPEFARHAAERGGRAEPARQRDPCTSRSSATASTPRCTRATTCPPARASPGRR